MTEFGIGTWRTRNGSKAAVIEADRALTGYTIEGDIKAPRSWYPEGHNRVDRTTGLYDLKGPWEGLDADGWIEWKGGECPVAKWTRVDVRYRNGQEVDNVPAGANGAYNWDNDDNQYDIVAYRVVKPAKEKADPVFEGGVSAVPLPDEESQPTYFERLRDKAALAALQGMMVSPTASTRVIGSEMAENAYRMADAFMAERAKRRS